MSSRRLRMSAAVLALILLVPAAAQAQTGFGVRFGSLTPDGDNLKMEASTAFGAHVALGFIPILKFQVGVEYLTGTADYTFTGVPVNDQDYKSIGLFADVRYPISLFPLVPIKPIVGGGININLMTYLDEDTYAGGATTDPENFTRTGYHLMFGLMFKPPVLPFTITGEYRLQTISVADGTVTSNGLLFGLTFGF